MATAQHLESLKMKHADLEAKIADEEGRPTRTMKSFTS